MTKVELTSVYYIKKEIKMWEEQLELIESKAEICQRTSEVDK